MRRLSEIYQASIVQMQYYRQIRSNIGKMMKMILPFQKYSKRFLESLDTSGKPPTLISTSIPSLQPRLLLSFLYYAFILFILYTQLPLVFQLKSNQEYLSQRITNQDNHLKLLIGRDLNITLKNFEQGLNLLQQQQVIETSLQKLYITDGKENQQFEYKNGVWQLRENKWLQFGNIQIKIGQQQLNGFILQQVNLSISSLKQNTRQQLISVNYPFNSSRSNNILHISLDFSVQQTNSEIFSFQEPESSIGILSTPVYSFIQSQQPSNTLSSRTLIRILPQPKTHTKLSSTFTLSDLVSNLSCILLLCYFCSFFLFFQYISRNAYLSLASRIYILKHLSSSNKSQLIYQNILTSCSFPSASTSQALLIFNLHNKALIKIKQKLDISNILKQLHNLQILTASNNSKISNENLQYTISTLNPYEISKNTQQKILEYMRLEDIIKGNTTKENTIKDIFKSPLTASILHKLNHQQERDQYQFQEEQEEQDQDIQLPKHITTGKWTNPRKLLGRFFARLDWLLQQMDLFSYRVGFFFDQSSGSMRSSLAGCINFLKIWLFLMFSFSIILSFLYYQPSLSSRTVYSSGCSRSMEYPSFYLYIQNTTSNQYLSFNKMMSIATISYNLNNQSYALHPISTPLSSSNPPSIWSTRPGAKFSLPSTITPCTSNTSFLEIQYICPTNSQCQNQMYQLFDLNFYLLLPQTTFLSSTNRVFEQQIVPYAFKYQFRQQEQQNSLHQQIKIVFQQTIVDYDRSVIPYNKNKQVSTYFVDFEQSEVKYILESEGTPMTTIRLLLSDRVTYKDSRIIGVIEFVGTISSIWWIIGVLGIIVERYVKTLEMKMNIISNKEEYKRRWWDLIRHIIIKVIRKDKKMQIIEAKSKDLFSIQKIIQRLDIAGDYILSCQSSSNRILLNTYMKQQLYYKPKPYVQQSSPSSLNLPQIQIPTYPSIIHHKLQDTLIHHHTTAISSPMFIFLSKTLNKLNIFQNHLPALNLKSKTKISSVITQICSLVLIAIGVSIIGMSVVVFKHQSIIRDQQSRKQQLQIMNDRLMEKFEFCIQFNKRRNYISATSQLIKDYLLFRVQQNSTIFPMIQTQSNNNTIVGSNSNNRYCIDDTFKSLKLSSSSPWIFTIKQNPSLHSLDFSQHMLSLLRQYTYSLCLTNYYHTSHLNTSISSKIECIDDIQLKQRANEHIRVKLQWNNIQNLGFYHYSWKSREYQYKERKNDNRQEDIQTAIDNNQQLVRYEFQYTQGRRQIIQQQSMSLIKKIIGVIMLVIILKPLGIKYNEARFVLLLSRQLYLIDNKLFQFSAIDVLKVMILSHFKFRIFMTKHNRVMMRSYLKSRQNLSYKNFINTLTFIQNQLELQTVPQLSILLKTYIKPEIFLQSNLNKVKYKNKLLTIYQLKQLHSKVYNRLKDLGLNDDQMLVVLYSIQNQNGNMLLKRNKKGKNKEELTRRIQYFKKHLNLEKMDKINDCMIDYI